MVFLHFCGAFLSFVALVFTAIALATNFWFKFDERVSGSPVSELNPVRVNDQLPGLVVTYDADNFGLWVGCHKEKTFGGKKSCAYVRRRCDSKVCWIRNREDTTCMLDRFEPVQNCSAYQATRAMTIIGTLFLIVAASLLVVAVCVDSGALAATGGLMSAIAGIFLMIAFAVFLASVVRQGGIDALGNIGWSFILLIVAWPLCILAAVFGCLASALREKEYTYDSQD